MFLGIGDASVPAQSFSFWNTCGGNSSTGTGLCAPISLGFLSMPVYVVVGAAALLYTLFGAKR